VTAVGVGDRRNKLSVRGIKDTLRDERGRLIVVEDGSITIRRLQGRLSAVRQTRGERMRDHLPVR
jgi:hypothetical protein